MVVDCDESMLQLLAAMGHCVVEKHWMGCQSWAMLIVCLVRYVHVLRMCMRLGSRNLSKLMYGSRTGDT